MNHSSQITLLSVGLGGLLLILVLVVSTGIATDPAGASAPGAGPRDVDAALVGQEPERTDQPLANSGQRSPAGDLLFEGERARLLTEADYYEAFLALHRDDVDLFPGRIAATLNGPSPLAAKRAALRAWHDRDLSEPLKPFAETLCDPSADPKLRRFALDFLAVRARGSSEARGVLADFLGTRPPDARMRSEAMSAVLRWGGDAEIQECVPHVYAERDRECIGQTVQALLDNKAKGAPATLSAMRRRHPAAAVRKQLRELLGRR
ncbi:MAG: hypothetical protein ACYST0_08510 [Planctomycetota bacterium]|jgi:hypothetical protein